MRRWFVAAAAALLVTSAAARAGDPAASKPMTWPADVVVVDEDGDAVAGARVEAFTVAAVAPRDYGMESPPVELLDPGRKPRLPDAAAATDAAGVAHVQGLAFGRSRLVVTRPGFAPRRATVTSPGTDAPVRFELLRGHPLDGRVLLENGTPVAGALVVAAFGESSFSRVFGFGGSASPFDPWTRTDAAGRWHFDAVPEGEVVIAASPAGTWSSRLDRVRVPGVTHYDFVLEPQAPLSGTVRDKATGDPVAGALLEIDGGTKPTLRARAISDAGGRWSVPLFPPCTSVRIFASGNGWTSVPWEGDVAKGPVLVERAEPTDAPPAAPAWVRGIVLHGEWPVQHAEIRREGRHSYTESADDGTFLLPCDDAAKPVRVWAIREKVGFLSEIATPAAAAAAASPVVLRWPRTPTFRITGIVRAPDGVKLVRPRVAWGVTSDTALRECWSPAAPDGRFVLDLPESARDWFNIVATADGCAVSSAENPATDEEIQLTRGASLRGRVLCDGGPVARASIRLRESDWQPDRFAESHRAPVFASSADDGSFAVAAVATGKYDLIVSAAGMLATSVPVELADGTTVAVDVALLRPRTIRGVVKWPDGRPVVEANLWARRTTQDREHWQDGDEAWATTDAEGAFVLRGLRPGPFDIGASSKRNGQTVRQNILETSVSGVEAGTSGVSIVVRAGQILTGRVVDERGAPVAGALVVVQQSEDAGWDRTHSAVSAADGSFELPALGAGPYELTARAEKRRSVRMSDVRSAAPPLRLVLRDGLTIDGVVVDRFEVPQAGCDVIASRGDDTWPHPSETGRARTDASGRFHVDGLDDGVVRLQIWDGPDFSGPDSYVTSYAKAGDRDVQIAVPSNHVLVGVVSEDAGENDRRHRLPGAAIRVEVEGRAEPVLAVTDESGTFRIGDLPWMRCTVHATLDGYEEVAAPTVWPTVMEQDVRLRRKPAK